MAHSEFADVDASIREEALVKWLHQNGLDDVAANFVDGVQLQSRLEGDVLWLEHGTPDLTPEDIAPVVARRIGRSDPDAFGEAEFALWEAVDKFGPLPANPEQVWPHLDRLVRYAEGRARQRLLVYHVGNPEVFHKLGVAPRPRRTPYVCTRPRGATRVTRARRRVVRRRARSPSRKPAEPDLELVAATSASTRTVVG